MIDYELEFELDNELEAEFEDEYESEEFLGALLSTVAPLAIRAVGNLVKESEFESELDGEFEYELDGEWETTPNAGDKVMMNHLANLAANSQTEAEAEAFLGAIASLASKAIPFVSKVAPTLIRGASKIGSRLLKSPQSRRLIRTIPSIMEGTVKSIANQAARGGSVNSQTAARALAANTSRVLRSPRRTRVAMRRTRYPRSRYSRRRYAYGYR